MATTGSRHKKAVSKPPAGQAWKRGRAATVVDDGDQPTSKKAKPSGIKSTTKQIPGEKLPVKSTTANAAPSPTTPTKVKARSSTLITPPRSALRGPSNIAKAYDLRTPPARPVYVPTRAPRTGTKVAATASTSTSKIASFPIKTASSQMKTKTRNTAPPLRSFPSTRQLPVIHEDEVDADAEMGDPVTSEVSLKYEYDQGLFRRMPWADKHFEFMFKKARTKLREGKRTLFESVRTLAIVLADEDIIGAKTRNRLVLSWLENQAPNGRLGPRKPLVRGEPCQLEEPVNMFMKTKYWNLVADLVGEGQMTKIDVLVIIELWWRARCDLLAEYPEGEQEDQVWTKGRSATVSGVAKGAPLSSSLKSRAGVSRGAVEKGPTEDGYFLHHAGFSLGNPGWL